MYIRAVLQELLGVPRKYVFYLFHAEYTREVSIQPRRQPPHNLARGEGEIAPVEKPTAVYQL